MRSQLVVSKHVWWAVCGVLHVTTANKNETRGDLQFSIGVLIERGQEKASSLAKKIYAVDILCRKSS
ncbi:unnamed protein product [Cuscuta campestris]|uniref:Uncharacterized protein n=1 Tax=Cuscuta campestris TaxID=132261 RepID=A0A484NND6_9ASTE|nr:unnamed protein product [Cuscuta campestris]